MSNHLGLLEIECDAPSFPVVRACRRLGLRNPEDVRWCRHSRHVKRERGWMELLARPLWSGLLGRESLHEPTCSCGQPLPKLECYSFTFQDGEQVELELAQCYRCRTVYWEEV